MEEYTTVKVSKGTLQLLVRYKALIERTEGKAWSFNKAIAMAIIVADWYLSSIKGLTDKEIDEYTHELLDVYKSPNESKEIEKLAEEANAYGFNLIKQENVEKK
jgi:uncharacterized protein with ATP-grasp and redox domains